MLQKIFKDKQEMETIKYHLIDLERTKIFNRVVYWKWNGRGYTCEKDEAGIFPMEMAKNLCQTDKENHTLMVYVE